MKHYLLGLILLGSQANAAIYSYDMVLPSMLQSYMTSVNHEATREGQRSCEDGYATSLADGVYDIRYALGYFDDSTGDERVVNGVNYGLSPSLDITVFEALRNHWVQPCYGGMRLCGFRESGNPANGKVILTKKQKIQGKSVEVRITLTFASASESFQKNKTTLADKQRFLTAQSEENYFEGLKVADVVFYNGHSRDGGGPDFNPPVLNSRMKTNYSGYYHVKRPGFHRMMESLRQNSNKDVVVGMFSCYSRRHFQKEFLRQNPNQKMVLSADTIDYFDSLLSSVGYLEGLLRGQCGSDLEKTAKQNAKVRGGFVDVNM